MKLSGKCEKCSIGYHGNNCSLKCKPPTYGEGCQALCDCPKTDCHFVHGCSNQLETSTDDHRYNLSMAVLTTSKNKIYNPTLFRVFTKDASNFDDSTLSNMDTDFDLLKNNVVISFIGVFAISFTIFVLAYIFFKCFRKTAHANRTRENETQAQYKLVRIAKEEHGKAAYRDLDVQLDTESSYLSPVFRDTNDRDEVQRVSENGIRIENYPNLRTDEEPFNRGIETNIFRDDETKHVYLEITKSNI